MADKPPIWHIPHLPEYDELHWEFVVAQKVHTRALLNGTLVEVYRGTDYGRFDFTVYAAGLKVREYSVWGDTLVSLLEAVYAGMSLEMMDTIAKGEY